MCRSTLEHVHMFLGSIGSRQFTVDLPVHVPVHVDLHVKFLEI